MPDIPLERTITDGIMRYLRTVPGSWWFKVHGGSCQQAGVPDIIGCVDGRLIGLEVKRPRVGRVSALQQVTMDRMRMAGALVAVVRSVDDVREVIACARRS